MKIQTPDTLGLNDNEVKMVIDEIQSTNFRISPNIVQKVLELAGEN
jgi:predicted nucleic acid-binding protein